MRHYSNKRTLSRSRKGRTALLRSLARSLVLQDSIVTTVAKAKELRPFVERLVTTAKGNSLASRRLVSTRLGGADDAVRRLHDTVAPRYTARAGGYTRITKLGRIGKQATESARIEFVQ
ncbi:50S ribosomal protein L17 [Candidatus Kaiserbacteria bacterium]|nr:50S ribosomal protein L17 [Candidatus Kaiserbacteria bacterium]